MYNKAILFLVFIISQTAFAHGPSLEKPATSSRWLAIHAATKQERTQIVNMGFSIETVVDDMSYGFAPESIVKKLRKAKIDIRSELPADSFKYLDFPPADAPFHNYQEQMTMINDIIQKNPRLVKGFSIGNTIQGRQIFGLRFNADTDDATQVSGKPGIVFMGGHHAREHLSVEVPLLLAQYLVDNYDKDPAVTDLINRRDIFIIPNINSDGAEYDISTGNYKMWRKNRKANPSSSCAGVDLNRNYGFKWGTGGSSTDPCSDVFMGPNAFSEPESQAVKKFVEAHPNLKILLTFHTYSELILYPWGNTYDPISNKADHDTYKKMAETMATWNHYTPQQSSELYIASGDTTDWSYGALGIFSFTFELSPSGGGFGGGGFYPGVGAIQRTFEANIRPTMYLIDLADNPHRAINAPETALFYGR